MEKILKRYKNRLVNINSNNRSLYLRKIDQKHSFDLSQTNQFYPEHAEKIYHQILKREHAKIQLFPDMIEFRHRFEQQFNRQIQQEQNEALHALNEQQATLGVEGYTKRWEEIEAEANEKRATAKQELIAAVKLIEGQQKKLAMLHRECSAQEKETGRYELKIGYPFIKGKFLDGTPVNAPLFLFTARLERRANNTWVLEVSEQPPTINRVFLLAIQKYNQTPIAIDVIEKFAVDKVDFTSEHLYRQLLRQFSLHIDWHDLPLKPFPSVAALDAELKEMVVGSFAVDHHLIVGNFPIANSLFHDYEQLQALTQLPPTITQLLTQNKQQVPPLHDLLIHQQYFLSAVDESQEQAIALAQQYPYSVIYGPPGTGKSQTIANMIGQMLAQQKTVLVVSHKKAALDVIYNRITSVQAQTMLLHQPESQAEAFFQKVSHALEQRDEPVTPLARINEKIQTYNQQISAIVNDFEYVKQFLHTKQPLGLTLQQMYAQSTPILQRRDPRYDLMRFWHEWQPTQPLTFSQAVHVQTKLQQNEYVSKAFRVRQLKDNPYVSIFAKLETDQQVAIEKTFQEVVTFFNQPSASEQPNLENAEWNLRFWTQMVHVSHSPQEFYAQIQAQKQALTQQFSDYYATLQKLETYIPKPFWDNFATALTAGNSDQLQIYFQQIDEALEILATYDQLVADLAKLQAHEQAILTQLIETFGSEAKVASFVQSFPELLILQTIRQQEGQSQVLTTMEQFATLQAQAQHLLRQKQQAVQAYLTTKHEHALQLAWKQMPDIMEALYHQVTKERAKTTIRESIHHYYETYFKVFPCWLASPETIADIFPFIAQLFDVVIFDEASQLAAEQTLPIFYRGKQIVVVGDDQQLQPPQLFTIKFDDDTIADETDVSFKVDSILDLAKLKYPSVKLNYHYRSQASELIAFSNAAFYDNELMVTTDVMQPHHQSEPAIQRVKVDGVWQEQTNVVEAQKIVELVVELFRTKQPHESLGVITFNSKQKDLILDLLEQRAQTDAIFEQHYFLEQERFVDGEDISFFVKNIENVQGDERDIMLFSTAYAPNSQGKMNMHFGSLSQEGGENRLNVAITRARQKIMLVTSIEPEQLEVEQTKYQGAKLLKAYLMYVRAVSNQNQIEKEKVLRHLQSKRQTDEQQRQSLFAKQVALNLELKGYEVKQNLGTKMYQYDLAIYDAQHGGYLLGIECDTPPVYPRTAKHRDVIKQQVLAQFGWKTMRVWSRDWWLNPEKVLQEIEQRIEEIRMEREQNE